MPQNVTEIPLRDEAGQMVRDANGKPVVCREINGNAEKDIPPGIEGKEWARTYPLKETVDAWVLRGKTEAEGRARLVAVIMHEAGECVKNEHAVNEPFPICRPALNGDMLVGWYSGPPAKFAGHAAREHWKRLDRQALMQGIFKALD